MRIGIDNISPGLSTMRSTLGGMRSWMEILVDRLPRRGPNHDYELFSPAWGDPFPDATPPNLRIVPDLQVPANRYGRAAYEQLALPRLIGQRGISVWLGTCNTLPVRAPCHTVLVVQSVQYRSHPETYRAARRFYLQTLLRLSVRRADAVVVFSSATKEQLIGWYGLDPGCIHVIPHGVRFRDADRPAPSGEREAIYAVTGGPYILSVSALYPYKNLKRLIRAFASLDDARTHRLVFAGAATPALTANDLLATAREAGVADRVVCLGRVPDADLPKLYRQATVMAMPSLEETFGIPVLEAMAFGCPVVTSNLSSMPEIVGAAGILVDPHSEESIAAGLRRVLASADEQQRLRAAGRNRAGLFTYDRSLASLMRVLEAVAP